MTTLNQNLSTLRQSSAPPANWRVYGVTLETNFEFNHALQPALESGDQRIKFECRGKLPIAVDLDNCVPIYRSPGIVRSTGLHNAYLFRESGQEVYRFPQVGDFLLNEQQIICRPNEGNRLNMIEIYLLGLVFSYWFEKRGIQTLHASGVAVDGRGVLFLASSKSGKSTLAASLMQAGHPLLGDNLAALESINGTYFLRPAFPCMRMWPDTAQHFLQNFKRFRPLHPQTSKRLIPVGRDSFGSFEPIAQPLYSIYIPYRKSAARSDEVLIYRLEHKEAIFELLKHSFVSNVVLGLRWQDQRIQAFTRLLQKVRVSRLEYPEGYQHLPLVREKILEDLRDE